MSDSIPTWAKGAIGVVLFGAVAGGVYYVAEYMNKPAVPSAKPTVAAAPAAAPAIEHPVAEVADPEQPPLPDLHDSDPTAIAELIAILQNETAAALIKPEFLIPRIVTTVDNLPRDRLNSHALPINRVPGDFVTATQGDQVFIADNNTARYTPYIDAFARADTESIVKLYQRWYPLFQQAYRDLGDPDAYFNDRLIVVIDHMLAAPDADPPIALVKPKSMWEYADPALQSASIGHRLMMRIGPAHAARVKAKLMDLRNGITAMEKPAQ
jgi:Protein of unknown function (DUF3014)